MTTAPLPIRNFTRFDFLGVLFVFFPTDWPWRESRRDLERLIRRNGDTETTPATVVTAFLMEQVRLARNLSPAERGRLVLAAWEERARRIAPALEARRKERERASKPEEWDF